MNNNGLFQFDLPEGWEDQTVYVFRGPSEDGREHNLMLMVDRHVQLEDIGAYAHERIDPLMNALQSVEPLKDEEVTIEGGNPAYEFVYKWIPSENYIGFQKYLFIFKDGLGFTFSICFSKKSLKLLGSQVNDIIETLVPGTFRPLVED
ncbi:MAG: DcrB-related protein [Candidatus Zixiibacteriota bacterium]